MSHFPVDDRWQSPPLGHTIMGHVCHSAHLDVHPAPGPQALGSRGFSFGPEPLFLSCPPAELSLHCQNSMGLASTLPNTWAWHPPAILTPLSCEMWLSLNFQQIHCCWIQRAEAELSFCHTFYSLYYILNVIPQPAFQMHWPNIFAVSWALTELLAAVRAANIHTIWKRTRRIISDRKNRSLVLTE